MERFSLKKLKKIETKEQYEVENSNRFAVWKTYTMIWILIELGKLLERVSEFQPKRVWVIMNQRSISHGLMKDVRKY
jgi:hypothetical protein